MRLGTRDSLLSLREFDGRLLLLLQFLFILFGKDQDRYGYQMLEKMGWANGKGLGMKQNGTTSHVKVKKRREKLGNINFNSV